MLKDTPATLLRSVGHFFSGTALSRITGLLRDIAMASAFGTQKSVAAFLMAFRFAHLLRRVLGEGAMQSAFVPLFEQLRQESPVRANRFFLDLSFSLFSLLLVLIACGCVGLGLLLHFDFFSAENQEVLTYTMLMLPSLLFICLFGINTALLQCHRSYFLSGAAPVFFNLVWIGAAVYLTTFPIEKAMLWLSGAIVLGCACQWGATLPKTWHMIKSSWEGARKRKWLSSDVYLLSGPLCLATLGVSASQINNALDVLFARYADAEGPAYLWYAIRLQQLPLSLFGIAISGALLPPLTRALKNGDIGRFQHFLSFSLRRALSLMIPMTAGIFLLGKVSIDLLLGHGDFDAHSIEGTASCLQGYGIGLIPMTVVLILAPAFYAQGNFRRPTQASLIAMATNTGLNAWFVLGLSWGAASVAWATSLSAFVNVFILGWGLRAHLTPLLTRDFILDTAKIVCATAMGSFGIVALAPFLPAATILDKIIYIASQTSFFAFLFFLTLWGTRHSLVCKELDLSKPYK